VIDGYGFAGSALLGKLREVKRPTLVIDDISDKSLIADIVLNQNVQDSTLYVDRAPGATLLLGPQFALIADAFRAARANGDAADAISGVLVSFGGSDLRGMTPHVLRCLEDSPADIKRIDVVVGPYHAQSRCGTSLRPAIYYHVGTENLCPLMARADVVVSSSGTSCWEACCLGRPLIAVQTVKNQREVAATLRRSGAALTLDATDGFSDDDFAVAWRDVQPVGVRNRLAATARDLVDGLGQGRVADALGF
jgi:UDP-2,4-diacetamido-2,4,6-trideoxy-beta-L-altropyranose hydrolase